MIAGTWMKLWLERKMTTKKRKRLMRDNAPTTRRIARNLPITMSRRGTSVSTSDSIVWNSRSWLNVVVASDGPTIITYAIMKQKYGYSAWAGSESPLNAYERTHRKAPSDARTPNWMTSRTKSDPEP